ncbi:tetratricopeptide repeat protein [Dactylosporangium sp. CA-139066]|uniref:tetratricopeptide repeat protein n=1 Tax=Dactylosporangium sp. CA-139066 TaxID=3239930 RepID=UPI003D8F501A
MTGLARAAALLEIGRSTAARYQVLAYLAEHPQDAAGLCLLARTWQAEDDFGEMRAAAAQAVAVEPEESEGHRLLAFALVGLGEPAAARANALEAVRLAPEDWRSYAALAMAEFDGGHRIRAFRTIRRAVLLAPDTAGPHYIRAVMFQTIGRNRAARRSFERVLAIEPENTDALTGLGRVAVAGGRVSAAAGHAAAVLAAEPNDRAARTVLDRALLIGLGGVGIMAVWFSGLLGTFGREPWMWAVTPLPVVLWLARFAWVWRSLPPSVRRYARGLPRTDRRARARLGALVLCAATGIALTVVGVVQDAGTDPTPAVQIAFVVHIGSLVVAAAAVMVRDGQVAAREPASTDLLEEHRESAEPARWALRIVRNGSVVALPAWLLSIDPPAPWGTRAIAGLVGLALFLGNAVWSRRRLIRRPGRPNPVLGALLVPLSLAALAELAVIVACTVLPPAAMPLPDPAGLPGFFAIGFGLLALAGWLPYAAYQGVTGLIGHPRARRIP